MPPGAQVADTRNTYLIKVKVGGKETIYQPHPLGPPLLPRRGGGIVFEGASPLQSTLNKRHSRPEVVIRRVLEGR